MPSKGIEPVAGQQQIEAGSREAADTKPQPRQKPELCRADSARSDRGCDRVAAGAAHAGQRPNGTAVSGIGSSISDAEAAAVLARRMSEAQPLAERGDTAAAVRALHRVADWAVLLSPSLLWGFRCQPNKAGACTSSGCCVCSDTCPAGCIAAACKRVQAPASYQGRWRRTPCAVSGHQDQLLFHTASSALLLVQCCPEAACGLQKSSCILRPAPLLTPVPPSMMTTI